MEVKFTDFSKVVFPARSLDIRLPEEKVDKVIDEIKTTAEQKVVEASKVFSRVADEQQELPQKVAKEIKKNWLLKYFKCFH